MRPASRNQNANRGRRLSGEVIFAAEKIERTKFTCPSYKSRDVADTYHLEGRACPTCKIGVFNLNPEFRRIS